MDAPPPRPPIPRSWLIWSGAISAVVLFGVGLFVAGAHGLAGPYEWSCFFVLGTGLALALFWGSRRSLWFWPTVLLIVAAHVVALCALKWSVLPHDPFGSAGQIRGVAGADFAASALVLYIVRGLFGPEAVAKTGPEVVAKAVKLSLAALALIIPIGLTLVVMQANQQKLAALRVVFSQETPRTAENLMACLGPRGTEWQDATPSPGKTVFDGALDKRIRVVEGRPLRQVQVETVQGRSLYPEEKRLLAQCLQSFPR